MRPWIAAMFCLAGCGARSELALPEAKSGPLEVKSLALGDMHSCALLSDGTAACWGDDNFGELGDGRTALDHTTAIPLGGATGIVQLACGNDTTCAVLGDGTLECWGNFGSALPFVIGTGFSMASVGIACPADPCSNGPQYCGVLVDGSVTCWDGITSAMVPVSGLHDAVSIGIGSTLACALRTGGNVSCWGTGPLGDGTSDGSTTSVDVVGLGGPVRQLAVGDEHACALLEGGRVACWGSSGYGALGVAPPNDSGLTPVVVDLPPVKRISSYSFQSCAVLMDGTVMHWGVDFDPGTGSHTPVAVPGLSSAVDVASGEFHDCALLEDGHVECWGENYNGELGDGTKNTSEAPVKVIGVP